MHLIFIFNTCIYIQQTQISDVQYKQALQPLQYMAASFSCKLFDLSYSSLIYECVYKYIYMYMFLLTVYFLFVVDGTHCHNYASEFKHSQNVTQKQVREDLHV